MSRGSTLRGESPHPAALLRVRRLPAGGALRFSLFLFATLLRLPSPAIINPNYTPTDLVNASRAILALRLALPRDGCVEAPVVEALKGTRQGEKAVRIGTRDAERHVLQNFIAALSPGAQATGLMFVGKFESGGAQWGEQETPVAALLVGTTWFNLIPGGNDWQLDRDTLDLAAVWAGSAEMLARAVRHVVADPTFDFPVASALAWKGDLRLGTTRQPATGCLLLDAQDGREHVVLLSRGGDRVYRCAKGGGAPKDITSDTGLDTASVAATAADLNGDGLTDLASWTGESLAVASGAKDGRFSPPRVVAPLSFCTSLTALDVDDSVTALVAGTPDGPVLFMGGNAGGSDRRPLATGPISAGVERGGVCVVADLDASGCPDIVQFFEKATLIWSAIGPAAFRNPTGAAAASVGIPTSVVCGDYDADGSLDMIVSGTRGCSLLAKGRTQRLSDMTHLTGELSFHAASKQAPVLACAPCDINGDGRQGVYLFFADRPAMGFFNRGFSCFGYALQGLDLNTSRLKGAESLRAGQSAGIVVDLNGDDREDLLAVTAGGDIWALFGSGDDRPNPRITIALASGTLGPVTVTVRARKRIRGMYVVGHATPAHASLAHRGAVDFRWVSRDGKPQVRRVIVLKSLRVEL